MANSIIAHFFCVPPHNLKKVKKNFAAQNQMLKYTFLIALEIQMLYIADINEI